jgi:ADP-ribose pyrophosphatase YjhB (NUDIX family)
MTTSRVRASLVCQAEGKLLLVRLKDPESGVEGLYPPGGAVEPDETPAHAAERETLEETGVTARVTSGVELVRHYPFVWGGVSYDVTTHYFAATLAEATALTPVVDADYNLGAVWLPIEEALEALALHPVIAGAVAQVLREADHARWRALPNFGGPAALLLAVHHHFRSAAAQLSLLAGRRESDLYPLRRAFAPLAETLHHHHHAEEAMLFPLVTRETGLAPAGLVDDHGELTAAIRGVDESLRGGDADSARTAIARFDEVLVTHLDREERLVMPVLLGLSPREARALFGG